VLTQWGIKGRVLFLALVPALVIAAGLTYYNISSRLGDIEQALNERGFAIARQLAPAAEYGVFSGNRDVLARLAQSAQQEADVTAVAIIDGNGHTLAASGHALAAPARSEIASPRPARIENSAVLVFSAPIFQSQTEVENYLDPIIQTTHPAQSEPRVLGRVLVEISCLPSRTKKNRIIFNSLLITLSGLAITTLLTLRMIRQVTNPVMALAAAVARIGKGNLATRVHTNATGELATLERGVNNMAVALQAVQDAQEERRAILATVLDSLDAQVYVADMDTFELLFLNRHAMDTFGNITGKLCWQALQGKQNGPCAFCTNSQLLRADGTPGEPVIWESQNSINQRWYLTQDSAIKWVDGRIVRLEIATDITEHKLREQHIRDLERQIMDSSERERERIGHELHDSLGQLLTGIAFLSKSLSRKLAAQSAAEAGEASQIATLINQAVSETRQLARGLQPVEVDEDGLMSALEALAANIERLFHIRCEFRCDVPVRVKDNIVANHFYRIAQEAVNNAIKHGKAKHILIGLDAPRGKVRLSVHDDGMGFHPYLKGNHSGMGLQIMRYRAKMIGAHLDIESDPGHGTLVRACLF
jgi:signal transduction histidine kinase